MEMNPPAIVRTVGQAMSRAAAKLALTQARRGLQEARLALLDLHESEGWRALGYRSWSEFLRSEFAVSTAHIYRLLDAARVERDLAGGAAISAGQAIPERVLRELSKAETAAMRREVYAEAQQLGEVTSDRVRELVRAATGRELGHGGETNSDGVPPGAAGAAVTTAGDEAGRAVQHIAAECSLLHRWHEHLGEGRRRADAALRRYERTVGVARAEK